MLRSSTTFVGPDRILKRLSEDRFDSILRQAADDSAEMIQAAIVDRTPRGPTGRLAESITAKVEEVEPGKFRIIAQSYIPGAEHQYGIDVDKGTGIYGPTGSRIYPKRAKYLVFYWYKMGLRMKLPSVAGQRGQGFFRRGWRAGSESARRRFRVALHQL